ncbi:hybrid sensor histidine kinase/response regulator [candidate division KSB1 bacterium]|nr:MAG: hybrid sensor histidine kinase/response regulator [candidate division KSB1 bacterium]
MSEKARILVVDDEEGIRQGCSMILEPEGYDVDTAKDGNEGYEKFKKNSYDLILVDLMMPGMNGMELLKRIHDDDKEVITVVITGYATVETAVDAMKKGAYDYIPKPFTPDELIVVVGRGIEKRRLRLEAAKLREEREKNLLEVANEKSKIRTIIGCMADGILVINCDKQLVLWNPAAIRMLKLKNLSDIGQTYNDVIKNKQLVELIDSNFEEKKCSYKVISREIEIEEENKILMANMAGVIDENGEKLGVVLVLRDITKLKEIDKIKSQFVNMVAHELRAPLAAIEGYLEICLDGSAGNDPAVIRKMQERSKERAHALLEMVNDLLHLSSIEAGKIAQNKEIIDVGEVIEKALDVVKPEAKDKNINFKVSFDDDIPKILADKNDLEKVFINLIDNAYKYNHKNGMVDIKLTKDKDENYIKISIIDTGIGIPEGEIKKIFDEFYRVKSEDTRYITGTGLGLSIVKKIVESHFGYIEVKSEVGKGSSFTVFLPVYKRTIKNQRKVK